MLHSSSGDGPPAGAGPSFIKGIMALIGLGNALDEKGKEKRLADEKVFVPFHGRCAKPTDSTHMLRSHHPTTKPSPARSECFALLTPHRDPTLSHTSVEAYIVTRPGCDGVASKVVCSWGQAVSGAHGKWKGKATRFDPAWAAGVIYIYIGSRASEALRFVCV